MRLQPANVAEVHAVGQELVLRIHTQAELHAAGIIQLVHILEEEVAALGFLEQQRLYLIELIVVVGSSSTCILTLSPTLRFCRFSDL